MRRVLLHHCAQMGEDPAVVRLTMKAQTVFTNSGTLTIWYLEIRRSDIAKWCDAEPSYENYKRLIPVIARDAHVYEGFAAWGEWDASAISLHWKSQP